MKIGVFDSGIGGASVANAISKAFPETKIIFKDDRQHVPYGTRSPKEILGFVTPILQALVDEGCQIIVVACNTVSTNLIEQLRAQFSLPLIAMEPMVKPASESTKTGVICVCATPATLKSERYKHLKASFAKDIKVLEPDCSEWAEMIEGGKVEEAKISGQIKKTLSQHADVIVLGCTHYHWIEQEILEICAGRAQVIHPEGAIVAQLKRIQK